MSEGRARLRRAFGKNRLATAAGLAIAGHRRRHHRRALSADRRSRYRRHAESPAPAAQRRACPRHRRVRARSAEPADLGRPRLARRGRGRGGRGHARRRGPRHRRGLLHGPDLERDHAAHRHPDGVSVHPPRHRHRGRPRAGLAQRHGGHRHRRLPDLHAPRARRGPVRSARASSSRPRTPSAARITASSSATCCRTCTRRSSSRSASTSAPRSSRPRG